MAPLGIGFVDRFVATITKKKIDKAAIDSAIQLKKLNDINKLIDTMIRKVGRVWKAEKEMKAMAGSKRAYVIAETEVIFNAVKETKQMADIETNDLISLIKEKMDAEARNFLEEELKIQRHIKEKTLSIENFYKSMIEHFRKTGDRGYIYNFLRTAKQIIEEEIKESEKAQKRAA